MNDPVYKVIEIIGSSTVSSDDAIRNAVEKASQSVRHLNWFHVVETRGHIENGKVSHFQVIVKMGFRIED
jgi:flavin-binding protein dodecin